MAQAMKRLYLYSERPFVTHKQNANEHSGADTKGETNKPLDFDGRYSLWSLGDSTTY